MMKKRVLVLAPHPDDESITGLLPLRLREECAFEIWVLPVTLGSRPERRAERKPMAVLAGRREDGRGGHRVR